MLCVELHPSRDTYVQMSLLLPKAHYREQLEIFGEWYGKPEQKH